MKTATRILEISESVTLKLNSKAVEMAEQGKKVFNLTAGQLPFKPPMSFVENLRNETNFLKSFQYSPVAGFPQLRKKLMNYVETSREITFDAKKNNGIDFDCILSNGGKHALEMVFASLINPGDEVIIVSPFWISCVCNYSRVQ